jgi:hypothetical protein
MSEYEPTQTDLDDLEMADFDVDYSETEAWVESMLAGLAESDF